MEVMAVGCARRLETLVLGTLSLSRRMCRRTALGDLVGAEGREAVGSRWRGENSRGGRESLSTFPLSFSLFLSPSPRTHRAQAQAGECGFRTTGIYLFSANTNRTYAVDGETCCY